MAAINRRNFNKLTATGLLSLAVPSFGHSNPKEPEKNLKVLVMGGTNFVGPAIVNAFLNRGHEVTLFNRGITNPYLFPQLPRYKGDRFEGEAGYQSLIQANTNWDVVVDTWTDNPKLVEEAISVLKNRIGHYLFISSIAVYNDFRNAGIDENYALREGETYKEGGYNLNKVLCEQLIRTHFPANHTILRPGAIVGERDPGPFVYDLIMRVSAREEIMAPDSGDPVQLIDVKDLADYSVTCSEKGIYGAFNTVGPSRPHRYSDLIRTIKSTLKSRVTIHWMPTEYVLETARLSPFTELRLWIPVEEDPEPGLYQMDNQKAISHGLRFRDLEDTIRDGYKTLLFNPTGKSFLEDASVTKLNQEREMKIIHAWKNRM